MRHQRLTAAVAIALLVGAGLAIAATGRERSLAIYPPQRIPLAFDHGQHIEAGADCASCHDPARKSVKSSDRILPAHPECESCHEIEEAKQGKKVDPPSSCETCHLGYDKTVHKAVAKLEFPAPNLIFNHKVHVDRKIECKACHTDMTDVGLATRQHLPKMETCLTCHDGTFASAACSTCHVTEPSGRLKLSFASGILRPIQGDPLGIDHGPRYEFTHGTRAKLDQQICMECHGQNECQSCHDAIQKPLAVHPNDYITLHPVQARQDFPKCESCHRYQSFCAACHERVGIGMDADPNLRPRNVRVHPDYNTFVNIPGPQHHAVLASRDIKQCISCHREESCTSCHASRLLNPNSQGRNPHPDGFNAMCKALQAKNPRACLKCHTQDIFASGACQ